MPSKAKLKKKAVPPAKPLLSFTPKLLIVGDGSALLWSLSLKERLIRQFKTAGLSDILDEAEAKKHMGPVVVVRADAVIDQPLIPILLKRPHFLLLTDDRENPMPVAASVRGEDVSRITDVLLGKKPVASAKVLARAPSQLDTDFWKALRKRETPFAMILTPENKAAVEWRMFMGTYKGATDLVTKHVWPKPAFYVTRWLAPRAVTPNMVTTVGALLTILAFWLFLNGQFALGLAAAWAMTFFDTVDGKLARTTLTSSKWGDVFDHGIDLIHPPFWYVAWAIGLNDKGIIGEWSLFWPTVVIILGGYILQRAIEGIAIKWLGLEIHIWRPVDTYFRQITARRNPNLVILTAFTLFGKPDWGLLAVAVWTLLCLLAHGVQLIQAFTARRKTGEISSWMTKA